MHPMVLLGVEPKVEAHFGLFGDNANQTQIGVQFMPSVPWAQKSLWTHLMELLGDVDHVESRFSLIENNVSVGVR
jgi:hypothetical protein